MQERSLAAKIGLFLPLTILLPALLWGCGRQEHGSVLTLAGSTSVQPFAEKLADEYMAVHPDCLINVQGGGSTAGIQTVKEGVANIGMCSRELKENEKEGLVRTEIARDGLAIVVHPTNRVDNLTVEQIRDLFSGQIRNWAQVGGDDMPVRVITREDGSGTRGAFQELLMKETEISADALVQDSNGAVREVVAGDRNIIGYISLGLVDKRVKKLRIDGMEATEENAKNKVYKFSRPFLFLTQGPAGGAASEFIRFVTSEEGQRLLAKEGLVTIVGAQASHEPH
jgi:phosphate transport system substrate-binding protein